MYHSRCHHIVLMSIKASPSFMSTMTLSSLMLQGKPNLHEPGLQFVEVGRNLPAAAYIRKPVVVENMNNRLSRSSAFETFNRFYYSIRRVPVLVPKRG